MSINNKRKIAIFTGNRAEYGLQYPILKAIAKDPRLDYYLMVSGAHIKDGFGRTLDEIEKDGFKVATKIDIEMPSDTLYGATQAIGSGVMNVSKALEEIKPDFVVIYADRFESFAALIASTQMAIPTAHIEGGDYTEGGALDDSVRHAMTKLAHVHFTTNNEASERVKGLGEEPWRIYNVGQPALDMIMEGDFAKPSEVYAKYGLSKDKPIIICTQHAVTTETNDAEFQIDETLKALRKAAIDMDAQVIITYPNDDAGGSKIIRKIKELESENHKNIQVHKSLGRHFYHGVLNVSSLCIGNSSSGIKETPAFHCPCINVGSRQKGRLRADNVIDVPYNEHEITNAIRKCLFDEEYIEQVKKCINPYGAGRAGQQIAEVLSTITIDANLIQKKMTY